jgi:anti-sigma factor RsiW
MNEMRNEELVRLSLRRELAPEEASKLEAHFAAHPEQRALWDEERAVSRAVQSLPDVPVSSNFTAQVLQALERESRDVTREPVRRPWFASLFPRIGLAGLALCVGVLAAQKWVQTEKQEKFAADVSFAARDLAAVPNAELLQDFDAIRELGQVSTVSLAGDEELLRVLQ